jgi:uroporphyrinogen decarboxylase|tara:strand:+ start:2134 stop:3159 length:1026 start_codon:yes stop_codon:yes gene_type:complete
MIGFNSMNSRDRIRAIIAGQEADRCGFWLGQPHADTWPIYLKAFAQPDRKSLRQLLGDDIRWMPLGDMQYRHPEGKPIFNMQRRGKELSAGGVFADTESVQEVEDFEWPDPEYVDFSPVLQSLRNTGGLYRASGFWSAFFHNVADFMGMENYFIRMHTHPDVVHAITRHVVDFYLAANRRFFEEAGDLVDAYFFGNDFGTQDSLLISPGQFDEFVAPYFRELTALARSFGYSVILHSCGAIHQVIPSLLEMGVDALHPLQAKAKDMDAESLADDFQGRVAFVGGIDTQDLLVNGSPSDVRADVRRVKGLLGPRLVVSPSHEALLPNVSPENVRAMAEAALE